MSNIAIDASLDEWESTIRKINVANGWFTTRRSIGDDIALLHSEVSEAFEAYRKGHMYSSVMTESGEEYDSSSFAAELADVFIRLMDTTYRNQIDLASEVRRKCEYNEGRSFRHGGKVV